VRSSGNHYTEGRGYEESAMKSDGIDRQTDPHGVSWLGVTQGYCEIGYGPIAG